MAKYYLGINGAFSGKIGRVIGCTWKGIPYMRSTGNPRSGPPSEKETRNWQKFGTGHYWLKPLLVFLRTGFANYAPTFEGFNAAKSYNIKNAMNEGQMLPELVKVSIGDLPLSEDLSVSHLDGQLHFNWSTAPFPDAGTKDQVMVLAYHPESSTTIFDTHGNFRNVGNQILETYKAFIGKTVHVYAAFVSADRSRQSNSLYLGAIDC